jgi:hypothetical protein
MNSVARTGAALSSRPKSRTSLALSVKSRQETRRDPLCRRNIIVTRTTPEPEAGKSAGGSRGTDTVTLTITMTRGGIRHTTTVFSDISCLISFCHVNTSANDRTPRSNRLDFGSKTSSTTLTSERSRHPLWEEVLRELTTKRTLLVREATELFRRRYTAIGGALKNSGDKRRRRRPRASDHGGR